MQRSKHFAVSIVLLSCLRVSHADDATFPVSIHVDAARPQGELRPVWRFFGADEPNYAYMTNGRKLLSELGELRPRRSVLPHAQFADLRRRHARAQMGLDWRLLVRTPTATRSTTGRSSIASSPPIWNAACGRTSRSASCRRSCRASPSRINTSGRLAHATRKSSPAGPIRRTTTKSGRSWPINGRGIASKSLAARKSSAGIGKSGTNRTSVTGRARREEFHKLHDHAIAGVRRGAAHCARSAVPTSPATAASSCATFLQHCLHGTNYATGEKGTPLDFVAFHAKGQPEHVDGHVRMGIAHHLRTIDAGFRIIASFPELKDTPIVIGESDPRGLCRLPGSATWLPQLDDVLQLHRRQLRPQARARRAARREPRRRPHLGVRVRRPAVLRRLPRAGHQRHRPAGAQRLSHVRPDAGRAIGRRERPCSSRSTRC